jgi:hypothetical protein
VGGGRFTPLRLSEDYAAYVDGKPRYEGGRSFLQSRAIDLPSDHPHDRPDAQTICGLGHRKDGLFAKVTHRQGVEVFECTAALIEGCERAAGRSPASRRRRTAARCSGRPSLPACSMRSSTATTWCVRSWPESRRPTPISGPPRCWRQNREDAVTGVAAGRAALRRAGTDVVVGDMAEVAIT